MKQLRIEVQDYLHKALKVESARRAITLRMLLVELLSSVMGKSKPNNGG